MPNRSWPCHCGSKTVTGGRCATLVTFSQRAVAKFLGGMTADAPAAPFLAAVLVEIARIGTRT